MTLPAMTPFSLDEHRHRFAVWTAASAARRGLKGAQTGRFKRAIEATSLRFDAFSRPEQWPVSAEAFDELHERWAMGIIEAFRAEDVIFTYGRAAKTIAIYLKTVIVTGGYADHEFAARLHPPIDSVVLRGLARDPSFAPPLRSYWRSVRWTHLDRDAYFKVISSLREAGLDKPAFWHVERFWRPELEDHPETSITV